MNHTITLQIKWIESKFKKEKKGQHFYYCITHLTQFWNFRHWCCFIVTRHIYIWVQVNYLYWVGPWCDKCVWEVCSVVFMGGGSCSILLFSHFVRCFVTKVVCCEVCVYVLICNWPGHVVQLCQGQSML